MRFTWIALPLLLATLAPASSVTAAPDADREPERTSATDFVRFGTSVPDVAMPAPGREAPSSRMESDARGRRDEPPGSDRDPAERRPSAMLRVRILAADRATFAFLPDLTRELNGVLSSCATACPPPSSR